MDCIAFEGSKRIAEGTLQQVALAAKPVVDRQNWTPVLIFDVETSEPVEVDFRGAADEVARRLEQPARGPGRPKLGVVGREVTLLPRQWEWLNAQPSGASVALRKLVDQARRSGEERDRKRRRREAAYKFMVAMAGNEHGFEEATRALFAGHAEPFTQHTADWPPDVRDHARRLAAGTWE